MIQTAIRLTSTVLSGSRIEFTTPELTEGENVEIIVLRNEETARTQAREEKPQASKETLTMALMKAWLEEDATEDPEEIRAAEAELREFKRNMNQPRKETGARLLYPEAE